MLALAGCTKTDCSTSDPRDELSAAARECGCQLALRYIRGHAGHWGNHVADAAAGAVAADAELFAGVDSSVTVRQVRQETAKAAKAEREAQLRAAADEGRGETAACVVTAAGKRAIAGLGLRKGLSRAEEVAWCRALLQVLFPRWEACRWCGQENATTAHVTERCLTGAAYARSGGLECWGGCAHAEVAGGAARTLAPLALAYGLR